MSFLSPEDFLIVQSVTWNNTFAALVFPEEIIFYWE